MIELNVFHLFVVVVNPTNVEMTEIKFPTPGEEFPITCTVGMYK